MTSNYPSGLTRREWEILEGAVHTYGCPLHEDAKVLPATPDELTGEQICICAELAEDERENAILEKGGY